MMFEEVCKLVGLSCIGVQIGRSSRSKQTSCSELAQGVFGFAGFRVYSIHIDQCGQECIKVYCSVLSSTWRERKLSPSISAARSFRSEYRLLCRVSQILAQN